MSPEAQVDHLRPAWARIDLTRLAANYRAVAGAARVPLMPVVKADAYGHGAGRVARCLEALGAPLLAVAFPEEGLALRAAGVKAPIVVLGVFSPAQRGLLAKHALTPVVSTRETLDAALLAAREAGTTLAVHLKVDSGMTRLGFAPGQVGEIAARIVDSGVAAVDGFMTHLASADEDSDATQRQLDLFDGAITDLARRGVRPRWIHAGASAAVALVRPTHSLIRPGLLLYGLRPRPLSPEVEVRPVMTVAARICQVKEIATGTPVSYGGRWVASRPSRIATVPIGYADGVPRTDAMRERGQLSIGGRRAPVTGTVCMDFTMLDVTDRPEAGEGDEAVLFGDDPTAWEVADWAGTTVWQVTTGIGTRVPRLYMQDGRAVAVESPFP